MAQYFQVVDHNVTGEELQATYSNIVDQQGVHYIIQGSDPNQTFLVDNVIEQPVLQQFSQQQQLFVVSSPQKAAPSLQPLVLNHTLQPSVLLNNTPPLRPLTTLNRTTALPRPRNATGLVGVVSRPALAQHAMVKQRPIRPTGQAAGPRVLRTGVLANPRQQPVHGQLEATSTLNGNEFVKMEDGRVLTLQEYQKFIEQKRLQQAVAMRGLNKVQNAATRAPSPRLTTPRVPTPIVRPPTQSIATPAKRNTARIIINNTSGKMPKILRNFEVSKEIRDIIDQSRKDKEFENSIRMFVLLSDGEQRLITFTTPKEDCTIQEILEQVGLTYADGTKIFVNEYNKYGINLVVSVGFEDDDEEEPKPAQQRALKRPGTSPAKAPSPILQPVEESPKLIPGKMGLCGNCGFMSEDFNTCQRCRRKMPEGIKVFPTSADGNVPKKPAIEINLKQRPSVAAAAAAAGGNGSTGHKSPALIRKKYTRPRLQEAESTVVTLSSDEEDDSSNDKPSSDATATTDKEPSLEVLKNAPPLTPKNTTILACCNISCRTIRIGSYRFSPHHDITINAKEILIKVPHTQRKTETIPVAIARKNIFKILVSFQKSLPIIFVYVLPAEAERICNALGMSADGQYYYNPVAENQLHRRIVLLPSTFGEEDKWVFQKVYNGANVLEELNMQDANAILLKSCSADVAKSLIMNHVPTNSSSDVRELLIFPPGKGGISINTDDYMCLERDQFLNDKIIDFYLKYVVDQMPAKQRQKVQVFSTFFYTRLTTKPASNLRKGNSQMDTNLTPAQIRHARVATWTKNIDLFEKDFIIVPINENAHWFLAIICFPSMEEAETFDGIKVKRELCKRPIKKSGTANAPVVKTTPIQLRAIKTPIPEIDDNSDKDEAEGDDSEFDAEEGAEDAPVSPTKRFDDVPIKQPCILIFDSLAGAGRSRVVATLRDYLTCEYAAKKKQIKIFTKDVISGACPKIPQQTNYTDCGLYLLQYVEHFFKQSIKDYRIPIQGLKEWFDEMVVTRKREDITNLIKTLMSKYNKDVNMLPAIALPTQNGEFIPENASDKEDMDEDREETKAEHVDDKQENSQESLQADNDSQASNCGSASPGSETCSQPGDTSTNRLSAMSYLRAKRIVKVKGDGSKKQKLDNE